MLFLSGVDNTAIVLAAFTSSYSIDHSMLLSQYDTLIKSFNVVHRFSNIIDLKIAEALEIKKNYAFHKRQFNEMASILNLF